MIRPEPITVDGRAGVMVFLDKDRQPVEPSDPTAVVARAVFDDGGSATYQVQPPRHDLGGTGSGNFGHAGRPGEVGGSASSDQFPDTRQGAKAALQDAVGAEIPVRVSDHPTAIRAAKDTAAVLREMRAKGYEMPTEVELRTTAQKYPSGEAEERGLLSIQVPDDLPAGMSLDEAYNLAYGANVKVGVIEDWNVREIRKFTGDSFKDLIVHEMGHVNRRPMHFTENQQSADEFKREMAGVKAFERQARLHVSAYAAKNPDEFVAEVFTLLYNGKPVLPETRKVYDDLRGAPIR